MNWEHIFEPMPLAVAAGIGAIIFLIITGLNVMSAIVGAIVGALVQVGVRAAGVS
jgi:hypothetical protein